MFVACCLLFAVCCLSLFVVCSCLLFVVCCWLRVVRRWLLWALIAFVGGFLFVAVVAVYCSSFVVRCVLCVACGFLCVAWNVLIAVYYETLLGGVAVCWWLCVVC